MAAGGWRSGKATASIAAAAVGGLALTLVAAWFLFFRDVAEPTTVGEAVTRFREEGSGGSPVPAGVYVYATDGFEKTDALTGITHSYPRRSTITVTRAPCGVAMRWDVLKGRSTVWTFCLGSDGWTIASQDERHTFFGRTERTEYACSDTTLRPGGDAPGATLPVTCSTPDASERGEARIVARERLRVGRRHVATVHLRKTTTFTGAIRGSARYDFWLARRMGVPVRVVMVSRTTNDSAVGDVHYEERVELALTSLTPRR